MRTDNRTDSTGVLGFALRITVGITIGIVLLGIVVFAPVAAVIVGLLALSGATLGEGVVMVGGVLVFSVGFWGVIWWSENRGWARSLADHGRSDVTDAEKWGTGNDETRTDT